VLNTDEMRKRARKLPTAIFDAIDGGGGDEITLRENRQAFERIWFRPRALADVRHRDLSTVVLGERVSMPVLLAPCGMARMARSEGELAVARAAGRASTIFVVSGASSYPLEQIAEEATGPLWYQLYLPSERPAAEALLARVERSGYRVLCVTIDSAVPALRQRDYRNRLTIPPRVSGRLVLSSLRHPRWTKDFLLGKVGDGGLGPVRLAVWNLAMTIANNKVVTAEDISWLRARWSGPLVVKGVMRPDECSELIELGVDGIVVSNHGGRQLDGVPATIDVLPQVVEAVDDRIEVFVDGGFWRGADVVKAIALGARACLVGKAYMFGLAAFAEEGVDRVLDIFRTEIDKTMGLLGCPTIADIDGRAIVRGSTAVTPSPMP
jgi:isopentenyl diphosphate isomerase/L-lactate dehydrogenase-like FMN-dependent dehydrogenase